MGFFLSCSRITRRRIALLSLAAGSAAAVCAEPFLPPDMHALALSAIDDIYADQYPQAEDEAQKIIKRYPGHPAGYFFMAAALDAWMVTHFSNKREDEFYRFCELAVEKGEKLIDKGSNDEWVHFFMGGAEGYKGTYEARFRRWITAFRYGWKGVSVFNAMQGRKTGIVDVNYGIGCYEYWRSSLMRSLWWMPRIEDKRARGIEKLRKAQDSGTYTKVAAMSSLVNIMLNENRFAEALDAAQAALQRFPYSRLFLLGKGQALLGLQDFDGSESLFRRILSDAEANPAENHGMIAFCHFWIARNYFARARYADCIAECDLMKNYQFDDDTKDVLDRCFDEMEDLKKEAVVARNAAMKKAQASPAGRR